MKKRKWGKKNTAKGKVAQGKKGKDISPTKIFLYALSVAAVGGGVYLAYEKLRKKPMSLHPASDNQETIIINNNLPASSASNYVPAKSGAIANDNFPLKQGSRGPRVTQLQQALDSMMGEGSMRYYGGIDGIFGPLTAAALRKMGLSEVIDEKMFNGIVSGQPYRIVGNLSEVALQLYRASQSKLLGNVLSLLQQIKSVEDYVRVNESYKTFGIISKTIVTDLLDFAFKDDENAKQQIREEFLRIGLKVDTSGRWSLQGFSPYKDLITMRDTVVTDSRNNKIPVPRNTILGDEIKNANGMTLFRAVDNNILQVPTQDVKYT